MANLGYILHCTPIFIHFQTPKLAGPWPASQIERWYWTSPQSNQWTACWKPWSAQPAIRLWVKASQNWRAQGERPKFLYPLGKVIPSSFKIQDFVDVPFLRQFSFHDFIYSSHLPQTFTRERSYGWTPARQVSWPPRPEAPGRQWIFIHFNGFFNGFFHHEPSILGYPNGKPQLFSFWPIRCLLQMCHVGIIWRKASTPRESAQEIHQLRRFHRWNVGIFGTENWRVQGWSMMSDEFWWIGMLDDFEWFYIMCFFVVTQRAWVVFDHFCATAFLRNWIWLTWLFCQNKHDSGRSIFWCVANKKCWGFKLAEKSGFGEEKGGAAGINSRFWAQHSVLVQDCGLPPPPGIGR